MILKKSISKTKFRKILNVPFFSFIAMILTFFFFVSTFVDCLLIFYSLLFFFQIDKKQATRRNQRAAQNLRVTPVSGWCVRFVTRLKEIRYFTHVIIWAPVTIALSNWPAAVFVVNPLLSAYAYLCPEHNSVDNSAHGLRKKNQVWSFSYGFMSSIWIDLYLCVRFATRFKVTHVRFAKTEANSRIKVSKKWFYSRVDSKNGFGFSFVHHCTVWNLFWRNECNWVLVYCFKFFNESDLQLGKKKLELDSNHINSLT